MHSSRSGFALGLMLALASACADDEGEAPRDGGSAQDGSEGDGSPDGAADDGTSRDGTSGDGVGDETPDGDDESPGADGSGDGDGDGDPAPSTRIVGYLPVWRGVGTWADLVGTRGLTHLNLAFANPVNGTTPHLEATDDDIARLVANAHAVGTEVLISIGGGGGSAAVAPLLGADRADAFVAELAAYVEAHGLDGVDVDVEGSIPGTPEYAPFVTKLRAALHANGRLLTAALATWTANGIADEAYAAFDFVNVMAYDHCGAWTGACEQSTYDQAVTDLAAFASRGVPSENLVLGVPFYAWCWGSCDAEAYTYAELLARYPNAAQTDWIDEGGAQLSYNGTETMARKIELAKSHGGVMIWELGQDADGDASLLAQIRAGLR